MEVLAKAQRFYQGRRGSVVKQGRDVEWTLSLDEGLMYSIFQPLFRSLERGNCTFIVVVFSFGLPDISQCMCRECTAGLSLSKEATLYAVNLLRH